MRIVFPFLYGLHQLYHSATTAMILSEFDKDIEVICISCNKEHTDILKKTKSYYHQSNTKILELPQTFRYKYLNFKKKRYPSVNAMVKKGKKYFNKADIIVTTSHGTVKMFKKFGITAPKFIYQYHGVGDRKYGFDPEFSNYDMVLVGGAYHKKRLISEKIVTSDKIKVVGYPKFDYPIDEKNIKIQLFKNNNPIILYSPHWEPEFTSYKKFAKDILEYFTKNKNYNLIFAPHILLAHWKVHNKYNTNFDSHNSDNIIIDFGSNYSTDGTYIAISDIYIGDVSSMVYEFIAKKQRPCIFLNAHNANWKNNPDYNFWKYGPVIDNFSNFENALNNAITDKRYLSIQKEKIKSYISVTDEKPSLRAAKAILEFIGRDKI